MSRSKEINRHQRDFLRKMRQHPTGLPSSEFPSPVALRRWMRHAGFRKAIASVRAAIQLQGDLQLLAASAAASGGLAVLLTDNASIESKTQFTQLVQLIRVAHARLKEQRQVDMQQELINIKRPPEQLLVHPVHAANPVKTAALFRSLREARAKAAAEASTAARTEGESPDVHRA